MNNESKIIDQLKKEYKKLLPVPGLKIKFGKKPSSIQDIQVDFQALVIFGDLRFRIMGEVVSQNIAAIFKDKLSRLKTYASEKDLVPIIVTRYLSPGKREECKNAGVNFIDLSGNVRLIYNSLYIEREGFPNRFPEERKGRGPFSDKASLILRLLLSQKDRLWGIREIAGLINLNPGFVSRMAKELENRNYVARANSKIRLRNAKSVLDDWVRDYNFRKNKQIKYFCLAESPQHIIAKLRKLKIPANIVYALSLHAGANLIEPFAVFDSVHIYVQNQDAIKYFEGRLKLKEVEQGANIVFLIPYYRHSVLYDMQKAMDLWIVSDIQLYLDLYNYPIRGLEQAEHLYEKRLKNLIND
jgi:DNA-binding transcriptional regulator YhcF (GntR family)